MIFDWISNLFDNDKDKEKEKKTEQAQTPTSVKKAKKKYDLLNNSEYKYLINEKAYRNAFISDLNDEIEKIRNTSSFGYTTQEENEKFKNAALEKILRIIFINTNYDTEKNNRDLILNSPKK